MNNYPEFSIPKLPAGARLEGALDLVSQLYSVVAFSDTMPEIDRRSFLGASMAALALPGAALWAADPRTSEGIR